jgi:hypothetical protein
MTPANCSINALLASTKGDYQFNETTKIFMIDTITQVIGNYGSPVKNVLFIYYAANEEGCEPYLLAAVQELFGNIPVECIVPGKERGMINDAEAIAVGGGDINKLKSTIRKFNKQIWQKVLAGIPYVGWNAGAEFLSSDYISLPADICTQFSYFPLQVVTDYVDATERPNIDTMITSRPNLKYALCLPETEEGGGIVIEDSRVGLAGGTKTDAGEPQGDPQIGKYLYIFEPDGTTIREVAYTQAQVNNLPITYM